jgi:hypothetical protein
MQQPADFGGGFFCAGRDMKWSPKPLRKVPRFANGFDADS